MEESELETAWSAFHYHRSMFLLPTLHSRPAGHTSTQSLNSWALQTMVSVWFRHIRSSLRIALVTLIFNAVHAWAQPVSPLQKQPPESVPATTAQSTDPNLTAEVVYLVLLGEMQVQANQSGAGYSLILEAARKSGQPALYRRAVNIALQSRSGDAALAATKAWAQADKESTEPLRVMLQIMLGMNQIENSAEPLNQLLNLTPDNQRNELIDVIGQTYARTSDHSAALRVMTQSMRLWQRNSATASSAWAAMARLQLAAGRTTEAAQSLENSLNAPPETPTAGLLAVETLSTSGQPVTENRLQKYIAEPSTPPQVRLAYARYLLGTSQWTESERQLLTVTAQQPELPEAWLMLGAVQQQNHRLDDAQNSFKRYLALSTSLNEEQRERGNTQAYLSLAQIAEQQQRLDEAKAWLDRINATDDLLRIQMRRASLLQREGKLEQAIALIRATPEQTATDARAKLLAEAQLLRDAQQTDAAFKLLNEAIEQAPDDTDLLYEQAMLADKLGRFAEMERSLRHVIRLDPNNAHAHNALGYSMADRNERLPEAKELIQKALSLLPNDPFIADSLGWVEFRLGNFSEAARILRKAMNQRPDAEIASHLGEVLWTLGERDEAIAIFRQAHTLQPGNETLQSTLKRLGIQL